MLQGHYAICDMYRPNAIKAPLPIEIIMEKMAIRFFSFFLEIAQIERKIDSNNPPQATISNKVKFIFSKKYNLASTNVTGKTLKNKAQ
ncbi:hypothetical protein [Sediminibacillus albus]|uniref:hypothetical protein n=1 Tax=Sediminibacillus albus TaxID=407036 RepID=UPI000B879A21|nr:hypothetical protein [Sediminibacillus albus]